MAECDGIVTLLVGLELRVAPEAGHHCGGPGSGPVWHETKTRMSLLLVVRLAELALQLKLGDET